MTNIQLAKKLEEQIMGVLNTAVEGLFLLHNKNINNAL